MFKKMLGISALSVAVLTAMTANATTATSETPEITSKNAVNISDVSSVSPLSTAIKSGIYVTGQLGYAATHMRKEVFFSPVPSETKPLPQGGVAGRLAIGYQFNPNLAVELGYLQLSKLKITVPSVTEGGVWFEPQSLTLKQHAVDVVAKGILPVTDKFNLYGKVGVAYLMSKETYYNEHTGEKLNNTDHIAEHKFAPEVAIGASYNVTPNMFVDASITHIQPMGKNRPGNVDFAALGVGYNFG